MTRNEHVQWCKDRALEYLKHGDVTNAVTSMLSDMGKHEECGVDPLLAQFGMLTITNGNTTEARRFSEGFN